MDRFPIAQPGFSRGPAATSVIEVSPNSVGVRLSIEDWPDQGDQSDREPRPIGSLLGEVLVAYGLSQTPCYATVLESRRTALRGRDDNAAADTKATDR